MEAQLKVIHIIVMELDNTIKMIAECVTHLSWYCEVEGIIVLACIFMFC